MIVDPANRLATVQEYYFSKKLKEIRSLQLEGREIINLGIGSPDMPPDDMVIDELETWARKPESHGYQSYIGIPEFREAISDWLLSTYGVSADANNEILPLIGSKEGIMHISMAFINPGDKVLVPDPGYPTYASVANIVGAEIINYHLSEEQNWEIDFDHMEGLDLSSVKLIWLNFPNMPTGSGGSAEQFRKLIALAKRHKFLVVNDNPYSLLFDGKESSIFQVPGAKEVCLELNSMSKSHNMAGWRLGWVTGHADYIQTILKVKSNMDSGMFMPLQKAAVKALRLDPVWYAKVKKLYQQRRKAAFDILDMLGCSYDLAQGGMFVWAKVPGHVPDVETFIDELIMKAGVFITPGFIFGSKGERHIRISLCSSEEILKKAHGKLNAYLKINTIS